MRSSANLLILMEFIILYRNEKRVLQTVLTSSTPIKLFNETRFGSLFTIAPVLRFGPPPVFVPHPDDAIAGTYLSFIGLLVMLGVENSRARNTMFGTRLFSCQVSRPTKLVNQRVAAAQSGDTGSNRSNGFGEINHLSALLSSLSKILPSISRMSRMSAL